MKKFHDVKIFADPLERSRNHQEEAGQGRNDSRVEAEVEDLETGKFFTTGEVIDLIINLK